jgi:PAS domain S-box-containing protein
LGLRRKTQIVTGLVLLGLLAALYAVTRRTLLVQFSRLEEEQTRQNLDRISNAINNELDLLDGSARDDSMWDEAYNYVQHPQPGWGENTFNDDSYVYLRLNGLAYLNAAGEPIYAREFDSETREQKVAPPELLAAFVQLARSQKQSGSPAGKRGIVDLPDGPALVAVWPVLTSAGKGPSQGTLIMSRRLDSSELHHLGWTAGLELELFRLRNQPVSDLAAPALARLSEAAPVFITPLNENQVAGYTLLKGFQGDSSVLLRMVVPRTVHQQGRTTLNFLMLATLVVGLVFTFVNLFLLDRMILSRLVGLRDAVASIGTTGDLSERVPAGDNDDELSQLAASMNSMLTAIQHSRKDLNTQAKAIEACGDGIAILNERAEFVYMNRSHARIFGYESSEELAGKSWQILYSDDETARFKQEVMPALARNTRWEGEAIARRKDGSSFPQQVSLASLAEGGMVCVCRDLSERRKMEDQLRKKQRMESVGTLAGGIAHDFNNLLTVIIGYAQTLLAKVENDPALRSNVEHIVQSASRAASLTRQLLAFSRKQVLQPRVLDLNLVVRDLERMLRPLVGDDITMIAQCAPNLGCVKADLSQLEQVIVNLVVNARDAMPRGGRLVLSTGNQDLTHDNGRDRDVPSGRYVVLSVSDNGVGMDPEVLSRIFEPFYTTKDVGKGTGLGLSTVYGTVEQSGGYVVVDSKPGKGTEFKIFLPRVDAVPESLPAEDTPTWRKSGTETVLLVEDDAAVRELAHDILRSCGYRVLVVADPKSLNSVLQQNPGTIHILLTDVLMPGINGREVAREVRRQHPETKTLFMSGYAYHTMLGRGVLEAGSLFIQKPFTPSQLSKKVREVIDGVQSRATTVP